MVKELIKIANELDSRGLVKEADALDRIVRTAGPELDPSVTLTVNFARGKSSIEPGTFTDYQRLNAIGLMENGMKSNERFIDIEVGTSGTGGDRVNKELMDRRAMAALKFLEDLKPQGQLDGGYLADINARHLWSRSTVSPSMNTIAPNQVAGYLNAPSNPDHDFYGQYQYVKITINEIVIPTPKPVINYAKLANDFAEVTVGSAGSNYAEIGPLAQRLSDDVYDILIQLDAESSEGGGAQNFHHFQQALADNGKNFYRIACDKAHWGLGSEEIGEKALAIQSLLARWGVPVIDCGDPDPSSPTFFGSEVR
jgi:hypothetical protein